MKRRFLPFCVFSFVLGSAAFLFATMTLAGNPGGDKTTIDHLQQMRVNQNTGKIAATDILKAQEQVNRFSAEKSASAVTLNWQQLGPDNAAGRTRTVIFSNKDAGGQTILTGGVTGGIWKSRNLGLTWHKMNLQNNEVLRVTSMVQTASGTIYAATGESYCGNDKYIGSGIYRSDDDSVFTVIPNTQPVSNDPASDWAYITKLVLAPSGRIFAGTNTGLKYSDNGTDWSLAKSGKVNNLAVGPDGTVLVSIENIVYIAVGGDVSNFVDVSTNTSTTLPNTGVNGVELAIAPSDANIMYASLANASGGLLNVYKSEDKGTTWFVVFPGNNTYNPLGVNGCYANSLAVFPNDANEIFLGGNDIWRGKKYQATGYYNWEQVSFGNYDEGFYTLLPFLLPFSDHQIVFNPKASNKFAVATDDGISIGTIGSSVITFQHMVTNLMISQFNSVAFSMNPESSIGGAVYIGTEYIPGGNVLNQPKNGQQINSGYGGDAGWSMISPGALFFGTGTSAEPLIRSEDLGVTLSPTFLRSITNANFTPFVLWEDFNFTASVDSVAYINKSGRIEADSTIIVPSANAKFPMHYTTPVAIDSTDTIQVQDVVHSRFFMPGTLGGKPGIYMTKQALQFSKDPIWFRIGNIDPGDIISAITVSQDLSVLWAGTTKGKLFRLTNITYANDSTTAMADSAGCVIGHAAFDSTVYTEFKNRYITSIALAPDNQTVLITLGNYGNSTYVYKSIDGLAATPAFASVQGSLPAMPVYTGLFEMTNPDIVVLGTDFGVFSTDAISAGSPVWGAQNSGTGNVPVTEIRQQTNSGIYYYRPGNYGDLYLASYGQGLFFDDTFGVILGVEPIHGRPATENTLKVQPNPFTENVSIAYRLTKTSNVNVAVYDLTGRLVYSTTYGNQQSGEYTRTLPLGSLPSGTYLVRMDYGYGQSFGKALKIR
ncbi:MAG: T9SS type A sorting domain-containing protein [Bacteroidetes bacterium]|nr:T9SS type A sorting domain-containing protein [Bacteroidota bacterium]